MYLLQCFNDSDGTPCKSCCDTNIECVYSPANPSQKNPASSTSPQDSLRGEAKPHLTVVLREAADAADQGLSDAAVFHTQGESFNTSPTTSNIVQERRTSADYGYVMLWSWRLPLKTTFCRYDNLELSDDVNVVPQIRVGKFSAEMDALNQEIAEKASHCCPGPLVVVDDICSIRRWRDRMTRFVDTTCT